MRGAVGARVYEISVVNAGLECKRPPYGRGILQRRSHDYLVDSHECHLLFTPSCCGECFYYL